jgi:hypothetical protein
MKDADHQALSANAYGPRPIAQDIFLQALQDGRGTVKVSRVYLNFHHILFA